MDFTKEDIGKTIYAIGTGNNARRGGVKIEEFKIVSIKRIYVELETTYGTKQMYHKESGASQQSINSGYGGNSGYRFFRTIEEIKKQEVVNKMKQEIIEFFRYSFELDNESIFKIHSLIK
jgi:hypothetical protein